MSHDATWGRNELADIIEATRSSSTYQGGGQAHPVCLEDKYWTMICDALRSTVSETAPLVAGDLAKQREIHDSYAPSATPASADTERLNWLERFVVEVRHPLVHGSMHCFTEAPKAVEGADDEPSTLRAQIDYQRNGGRKP